MGATGIFLMTGMNTVAAFTVRPLWQLGPRTEATSLYGGCLGRVFMRAPNVDFLSMTVAQLKQELVKRGLPGSGRKDELLSRLVAEGAHVPAGRPNAPKKSAPKAAATRGDAAISQRARPEGPIVMVVESPAKCATIAKFAGSSCIVLACNGHVRTLPSKPNSVRPAEGFAMDFELVAGAGGVLKNLGAAVRDARALYLATDPDREGEAIAWHVHEALRDRALLPDNVPVHRISFAEITQQAVTNALAAPRRINVPLVRAQQARQAVDYLVGFTLSPVLWRKLPGCRSAGRVQSVALRLVVEREHDVLRFEPREHWHLKLRVGAANARGAAVADKASALEAELTHLNGTKLEQFSLPNEAAASAARAALPAEWRVSRVQRSERSTQPPAPYNTASLQQDASNRLGLPVGRVMRLAQSLYEGVRLGGGEPVALITYMRTDGIQMSEHGVQSARSYIGSTFGSSAEWLPSEPRLFKTKARNAQESHEAIRPVDFSVEPRSLRGLMGDAELRLYELIWRRALASQMANALHEQLAITLVPADDGGGGGGGGSSSSGSIGSGGSSGRTRGSTTGRAGAQQDAPAAQARASGSRLLRPGFRQLYEMPRAVPKQAAGEALDGEGEEGGEAGGGAPTDGAGEEAEGDEEDEEGARGLDPLLASLSEGDVLRTQQVFPAQQWTQPPPRFNEGSLVRHLEALGIGRPSTYASILKALQERGYVTMVGRSLRPNHNGELVTALLTSPSARLEQYVNTSFTARLEARLDAISNGELDATAFLSDWWSEFQPAVLSVEQTDTLALREEVAERCAWMLFPTAEVARPLLVGSGVAVHTGGAEGVDGAGGAGGAADVSAAALFEWPTLPAAVGGSHPMASPILTATTVAATVAAAVGTAAAATAASVITEVHGALQTTVRNGASVGTAARVSRPCPSCGTGHMVLKFSRFGPFVGCSEYPSCGWTTRPRMPGVDGAADGAPPTPDKLALGLLPAGSPAAGEDGQWAGLEVSVRNGPVGWYVQLGGNVTHEQLQLPPAPDVKALKMVQLREELERRQMSSSGRKPELIARLLQAKDLRHLVPHKRSSLPPGTSPANLSMAMAERLLSLPLSLGLHPNLGHEISLHLGRFGPYVMLQGAHAAGEASVTTQDKEGSEAAEGAEGGEGAPPPYLMASLPRSVSFWDADVASASALLDAKMARDAKKRAAAAEKKAAIASARSRAGAIPKAAPPSKTGSAKTGAAKKAGSARAASKATKPPAKSPRAQTASTTVKPTRAQTAYLNYALDPAVRDVARLANPDVDVAGLAKVLGAQWRALSDEAKAPYKRKYEAERERLKDAAA